MKDSIIFSLTANEKLAKKISDLTKIPLGEVEIDHFADGEILTRCLSNVSGKRVFIIQSTSRPATERIFEILIFADALKNKEAAEIVLVMPYYGYSRQDRVARDGEPITAKLVAALYQSAGIDRVITLDLHTFQIQGFFSCPVMNLETTGLFADYFTELFKKEGLDLSDLVVVTPDHGSALRARDLGSMFDGASLAFIDKRRPAPNKSEVTAVIGDVKNKTCLVVDDIIDTGGTINNAVDALFERGAKDIYVCATHAIFSSLGLDKRIKKIVTTDSVEKELDGIEVLSVAPLLAKAMLE